MDRETLESVEDVLDHLVVGLGVFGWRLLLKTHQFGVGVCVRLTLLALLVGHRLARIGVFVVVGVAHFFEFERTRDNEDNINKRFNL